MHFLVNVASALGAAGLETLKTVQYVPVETIPAELVQQVVEHGKVIRGEHCVRIALDVHDPLFIVQWEDVPQQAAVLTSVVNGVTESTQIPADAAMHLRDIFGPQK